MPHLPVRFFFPCLTVSIARDFSDSYGHTICSTDLIRLINCVSERGSYALSCLDHNIHLSPEQAEIIENADNTWFPPVPTSDCLEDLLRAIELSLDHEADLDSDLHRIERVRDDIDQCEAWIADPTPRRPAPKCTTRHLASEFFGPDHELSSWIRLLFTAVAAAS